MNPLLEKLGFAENERVVIFHADDIGMCQATLTAYTDLMDAGLLSSAAVMVPCPWFLAVADICHQRADTDIGVHLTLTSEWELYRWSGLTRPSADSGLVDEQGYFHHRAESVWDKAVAEAVEAEITAQVERAQAAGIDITHIDNHMGTMFSERFMSLYISLPQRYHVPVMMPRVSDDELREHGLDDTGIAMMHKLLDEAAAAGMPVFDHIRSMSLNEVQDDPVVQAIELLEKVPVGLTNFILHPAVDTPELRAITQDWRGRVRDYEAFKSERLRDYVAQSGFKVIGFRALREGMRSWSS